jgi:hypothetical protein
LHKSKLAGFIIDCQTDDLAAATAFWSAALGMPSRPLPADAAQPNQTEKYKQLQHPLDQLHIEVQAVTHPSRVHLDIETDNVEAEVSRLESLGARRIAQVSSWWVMEAPTGQRFCVVRVQSPRFAGEANSWPDPKV